MGSATRSAHDLDKPAEGYWLQHACNERVAGREHGHPNVPRVFIREGRPS